MKLLLISTLVLLTSFFTYSQDTWTAEHIAILEEYGLQKNDRHGIHLIYSDNSSIKSDAEFDNLKEGLEFFFSQSVRKDLVIVRISSSSEGIKPDETLGVWSIVDLYLKQ